MMDMLLLTLPDGSSILVGKTGLCIEPEKSTDRSIVTLPHNHRHGKPSLTVTEPFADILNGLVAGGHVIRAAPVITAAQTAELEPSFFFGSNYSEPPIWPAIQEPVVEISAPVPVTQTVPSPLATPRKLTNKEKARLKGA